MSRHFIPTLLSVRMEGWRWLTSVATRLLPCVFRLVKSRLLLLTSDLSAVFCCFCGFLAAPVRPPSFSNLIFYSFSKLFPSFCPFTSPLFLHFHFIWFIGYYWFIYYGLFVFLSSLLIRSSLCFHLSNRNFSSCPFLWFFHLFSFHLSFTSSLSISFLSSFTHFALLIISCFLSSFLAVILLLFSPSAYVFPHILSSSLLPPFL